MAEPTSNPLAALRTAAEAVRQQLHVPAFDAAAVQRLAEFIETQRSIVTDADRQGVITALGCFLGQCLVDVYGGEWAQGPDGATGVGVRQRHFYNPFYRVAQQLEHGEAESVAVFFAEVAVQLENPGRRQWIS